MAPMDQFLDHEVPTWPKVVGIISIVWAGIGLTCAGCGVAGLAAQSMFAPQMEEQLGPMPDVMRVSPLMMGQMAIGTAWAFVLLAAGIATVMRKPAGRPLHLVYAIGGLILGIAGIAVQVQHQLAILEFANQNPGNKWIQQSPPVYGWIGVVVGIVLGLSWPVFCLIWFGLIKKRAADIAAGIPQQVA
ncbi:MAG: hypothetical protein KF745_13390 [Phycisphaeraceae bacterium]|nr:hypothetical protein [Phycisphaeraceae bacterium]